MRGALGALADAIRDASLSATERVLCVKRIEGADATERLALLVELARDCSLPPDVGAEVGRAVARTVILLERVDDVPLADFSSPAYLGYDEQVSEYLIQRELN